ncbi:hypothetical protein AVEN_239071-1 [Araneus ventricosus]|uniref:Uncharacterized protein n=1 Tax=Araneus ventricosus TaxID=182803 RepID=A0A4Y2ILU4_ARAVE|nr:hypothetical protein AVEN_239071-1 [Araneus ventricosus]
MDSWILRNHGQTVSIYELASFVRQAHDQAMAPMNILSGFGNTGIFGIGTFFLKPIFSLAQLQTDHLLKETTNVEIQTIRQSWKSKMSPPKTWLLVWDVTVEQQLQRHWVFQ